MTEKISDLILVNNHHFIILNKPFNVATQPDKSNDKSLLELAELYCKIRLFVVHRLDRPACGLVIFAKSGQAASELSQMFVNHQVTKTYLAFVSNPLEKERGTLENPIFFNPKTNKSYICEPDHKDAKLAKLDYETLSKTDNYTFIKINLHTGRHHQIRVQMSHAGHPIKGDVKYGAKRANKDRSIDLCAYELAFDYKGQKYNFKATLPPFKIWQDCLPLV